MSAAEIESGPVESRPVVLRPVVDSRPPAILFGRARAGWDEAADAVPQPTLLDALADLLDETTGPPRPRGVRVHTDRGPGSIGPSPTLPDPAGWVPVLGLAIGQALVGTRPVGQLECWLEPVVLADLRRAARERLRARTAAVGAPKIGVFSVRIQCPTPRVVESTIHLRVGDASMALGARLEGYGDRWVCTSLARPVALERFSVPRTARGTA